MPHARLFTHGRAISPPPPPPPPGIPLVGPHASWDGTAGSGSTPSTPASRTTANPSAGACFLVQDFNRFTSDIRVSVHADAALGGIDHVEFSGDIATTTGAYAVDTQIGPDGVAKNIAAHHIDLKAADYIARIGAGNWGSLRIYAKAFPVNVAMVPILIGPLTWRVSDQASDVQLNLGAGRSYTSGGTTYPTTTIQECLYAIWQTGKTDPDVLIDAGTYEAEDGTIGYVNTKSWVRFRPNGAAAVTIRRASPRWTNALGGYTNDQWNVNFARVQFEGITYDPKNIYRVLAGAGPTEGISFWHCNVINSLGTVDTLYWNGDAKGLPWIYGGYVQYCTIKWQNAPLTGTQLALKNKIFKGHSVPMANGFPIRAFYNYLTQIGWSTSIMQRIQFTLTYTGAAATATSQLNFTSGIVLTIKVAGHADQSITLGGENTATYFLPSAIVAWVNGLGISGLSATATGDVDTYNSGYIWNVANGVRLSDGTINTYNAAGNTPNTDLNIKSATLAFGAGTNYHADLWDQSDAAVENAFIHGNIFHKVKFLNPCHMTTGTTCKEFFYTYNFLYLIANPLALDGKGYQTGAFSPDHGRFVGNTIWVDNGGQSGMGLFPPSNGSAFDEVYNNACYFPGADSDWAANIPVHNSVVDYAGISSTAVLNSGSNSGNTAGNDVTGGLTGNTPAWVTDPDAADPRPTGTLTANLKARRDLYDMFGIAFSTTDAAGGVSKNTASGDMPVLPF